LVNGNERECTDHSDCTDSRRVGGVVLREGICIFVVLCVGQILPNPLQKLHYLFSHAE